MWKVKVLIQFILSKIPLGEKINHGFQKMNGSHDEQTIRGKIITLAETMAKINEHVPLEGATVVEIGTGWVPISSLLFYLMGAKVCHTYDHVPHVRYQLMQMLLRSIEGQQKELSKITSISHEVLATRLARLTEAANLEEYFTKANIIYHAPGDGAATGLEDKSVDLVYSNAVLEHVPKKVVYGVTMECKRILKKSGVAYHLIGLHDHYADFDKRISKVNFLKYSERVWSFFVKNKISYHNRLREKQFLDIIKECGGKVVWQENKVNPDDIDLLKTMKIAGTFQEMSPEELAIYKTELISTFS